MSRQKTTEETLEEFIEGIRQAANYWSRQNVDISTACHGMAHSILAMLDGVSHGYPAYNISVMVTDESKQDLIDEGMDYYGDEVFNDDCYMNDIYFR
jgi:hypothetical protein